MKRKWVAVFLEMTSLLVLVGCVSTSDSPTSPTPLDASSTSIPTNPHVPTSTSTNTYTNTPVPSVTATSPFLLLPTDLLQPTPLFTPAFPATAEGPFFAADGPTPIATPPVSSYQLKTWSEAEAIALIRYLNQTAYDNDNLFAGNSRGSILHYLQPVRQTAREFLFRYPNSVDREQVEWLLAFVDTLDRRDSDEWLVNEIAQRLNKGWLDPADMKSGLEPLGFIANPVRFGIGTWPDPDAPDTNLVMNLFGDGRPAYVWEIQNTVEAYYGHGMYLAVEQLVDSSFRVARIYSQHHFPYDGLPAIEVHELTGDGQPELIIVNWGCEFGCTVDGVFVFQWQQDHFAEIAHRNFGTQSGATTDGLIWEFEGSGQNNSSDIVVTNSSLFHPTFHRKLTWNGEWLHIAEQTLELPEAGPGLNVFSLNWIGYAMEFSNFNGIQPLFDYVLENPPEEEQGIAFKDFIRFQMAMVEAFSMRLDSAREQLQSIIDSPTDPSKPPVIAKAAAAFLEEYQGEEDIYQSCHSANLEMEESLLTLSNLHSYEGALEEWGFRPVSSLCNPRTAFRLLLSQLDLRPGEDVTARLRAAGVPVLRSNKADLDGDELDDWLVVVDTPASERTVQAWVFVSSGQAYTIVPVFGHSSRSIIRSSARTTHTVLLDTFSFSGDRHPATVLQVGDRLNLFVVHHKGVMVDVQHLLSDGDVASFEVNRYTSEITVDYLEGAFDPYHNIYAWQEGLGRFIFPSQIDRLIFEEDNPAKAIRVIEERLSKLDPERYEYRYAREAPQLYYMLGLAHELDGNSSAAVEAYLRVWREFPGSPYALIAREKIDL